MPATAADPEALLRAVDRWLWKLANRYAEVYGLRADDLAHEFRVAVFTSADTYDPARGRPCTWATWVVRAVLDRRLKRLRRLAREQQSDPGDNSDPVTAAPARGWADPAAAAEWREDAATLGQLLAGLPDRQRACLELRYGIGGDRPLSDVEIAARLGVSRTSVGNAAAAGLAKMRALAGA